MKRNIVKNSFRTITFSLFILTLATCKKDEPVPVETDSLDILDKLMALEGVKVVEIQPQTGAPREFQIHITQPVDHNNPNGPKFIQRAYLSHVDESMPMIFAPSGYKSESTSNQELAELLQTNCLVVSHRYFSDSRPSPYDFDWQYLNIKQAADDHHIIVTLFKKIYKGKWISSGRSKSGLTALFHKRYYPDDVDATIAYVSPFTFGIKDERYPAYLRNIGGGDCFEKLKKVQFYALKHRTELLTLLNNYIRTGTLIYSLNRETILELGIMDYPFTFWQYYNYSCSEIPDTTTSTPAQIFNHINSIASFRYYSDDYIAYYEPAFYQALTELGQVEYENYYNGLLKKIDLSTTGNPNIELLAPQGITYSFNKVPMLEIYSWLQNHGDKIIYIYGKNDPWSAGAIELTGVADALSFMQNGTNHKVRISDLDNPRLVYDKLESWLGIDINVSKSAKLSIDNINEVTFRFRE
jgi:hypothetical protein